MKPFFPSYGAKHALARLYGPPRNTHVIEPFAGSAGYVTFWEPPKVTLVEANPEVCALWQYLTSVSPAEILRLPAGIMHVDELSPRVCQEARSLIGFWLNRNPAVPAKRRSPWARNPNRQEAFWSETRKRLIASQLDGISDWKIIEGSYEEAPDINAHWFIDPPYCNRAGRAYPCHEIDYKALARWCKSRLGFVQVCEHYGATWLPFEPFETIQTHRANGYSIEALCEIDNRAKRKVAA